jgi:hypothetical protein
MGCGSVLASSLMADIIDLDESVTGERKEGIYSSALLFALKIGNSVATALSGLVLAVVAFTPNAEQSAESLFGMRLLMGGLPCLGFLVGAALFRGFPLGRLPVASEPQAMAVVNKIIAYDQVSPNDTWRRKMLLVADDQYSTESGGGVGGALDDGCSGPEVDRLRPLVVHHPDTSTPSPAARAWRGGPQRAGLEGEVEGHVGQPERRIDAGVELGGNARHAAALDEGNCPLPRSRRRAAPRRLSDLHGVGANHRKAEHALVEGASMSGVARPTCDQPL